MATTANLYELPDDTAGAVMQLAKKMAYMLREKLHCDGLNLMQNNGATAGQTVEHFCYTGLSFFSSLWVLSFL